MAGTEVACYWGIAIPELKMNLPIFKGLDNVGLYYGAGTMKEDQVMGKGITPWLVTMSLV